MLLYETHFVSLVTVDRTPLLLEAPELFYASWETVRPVAWVLMPDHFHAVLYPSPFSVYDLLQQFMIRYARAVRERIGHGRIWSDRIRDQAVRTGTELSRCIDFIHFDPVRHGLTDAAWKHRHSSFPIWVAKRVYDLEWRLK